MSISADPTSLDVDEDIFEQPGTKLTSISAWTKTAFSFVRKKRQFLQNLQKIIKRVLREVVYFMQKNVRRQVNKVILRKFFTIDGIGSDGGEWLRQRRSGSHLYVLQGAVNIVGLAEALEIQTERPFERTAHCCRWVGANNAAIAFGISDIHLDTLDAHLEWRW